MLEMSYPKTSINRLAYRWRIKQAISPIYGRIKLAKEKPFIDKLYLWNLKDGKSVEHEEIILPWTN